MMRVFNDFAHAPVVVNRAMEGGARTNRGEDWRARPAGFHLARARRHRAEQLPWIAKMAAEIVKEVARAPSSPLNHGSSPTCTLPAVRSASQKSKFLGNSHRSASRNTAAASSRAR